VGVYVCVDGSKKRSSTDAVHRSPGFEWFGSEAEKQIKAGQDALEFIYVRQSNMQSTERANCRWIESAGTSSVDVALK